MKANLQFKKLDHSSLRVVWKSEKLGTNNLKNILTVIVTFFVDVITVIKTKNWAQLLQILLGLMRFGNIIALAKDAWNELKDLDATETKDIIEHIKSVFDLENDDTEKLIERAFDVIPRIYDLVLSALDVYSQASAIVNEIKDIFGKDEEAASIVEKLAA